LPASHGFLKMEIIEYAPILCYLILHMYPTFFKTRLEKLPAEITHIVEYKSD